MGETMRRWILLAFLVIAGVWGGWTMLQRHREAVWSASFAQASAAFARHDYAATEKILLSILPDTEKRYSHDRRLANVLGKLGTSYRADHNYDQAEPILKRARQLYESLSQPPGVELGQVELNLAQVYRDTNRLPEAEEHFSRALAIFDKDLGATGYDRGGALLNLGFVCFEQGRYTEAEPLLLRAVEAYEGYPPAAMHPDLAGAFFQLAELYRQQSRFAEAEAQYRKASAIQEKVLGPQSQPAIDSLEGLAMAYQGQGKPSEANRLLARARQLSQNVSAPDGGADGGRLIELGLVAEDQGKYSEAESLYKQAIAAYEKSPGPAPANIAIALEDLGCLYRDQEQFNLA